MIKMNKLNLTKGKIIGYIIALVGIALSAVLIVLLNSFDKVELVSTYNRTFEKATVTKITKDTLEEDGERYGNQEVVLKIKTGSYAGKELSAISPNGNLFGAPCTVGLDVVAIVSANDGGEPVVTVYSRDREYVVYAFVALFVIMLWLVGGKKGIKSAVCLALTFVLTCIQRLFAVLGGGDYMRPVYRHNDILCCGSECEICQCYRRNGIRSAGGRRAGSDIRSTCRNQRL